MAILYNFTKELDEHIIEVSQITLYELYYLSDNSNSLVSTEALAVDTPKPLVTNKDGNYQLKLIVEGETTIVIDFDVIKHLQNSIIAETLNIMCGKDIRGCDDSFTSNCLSKAGKECLTHKSIFVKLLTFQTLYIPTYGGDYPLIFTTYLESAVLEYNCKLQTTINAILQEECVTGSVQNVEKLFKLYVAIYWAGMYFIEKNLATDNIEQLAFIKEKFYYDNIVGCLCSSCLDINALEDAFVVDPSNTIITSFQYDDISYDINDITLLTDQYLLDNGEVHEEADMLAGKNITFGGTARIGFVLNNVLPDTYAIYDILGNNITTVVFDTVYDPVLFVETFVSKTHYTPSTVYFKFIKN